MRVSGAAKRSNETRKCGFGPRALCLRLPIFVLRSPRMSKATLLIVDDEKPTREGLRAALEERFDV